MEKMEKAREASELIFILDSFKTALDHRARQNRRPFDQKINHNYEKLLKLELNVEELIEITSKAIRLVVGFCMRENIEIQIEDQELLLINKEEDVFQRKNFLKAINKLVQEVDVFRNNLLN